MTVLMIVRMTIYDTGWIESYFAAVPRILADHGAKSIAGSRNITKLEGNEDSTPDRVAILSFPSMEAVNAFMTDERYRPFRTARQRGATAEVLVFENAVIEGELC